LKRNGARPLRTRLRDNAIWLWPCAFVVVMALPLLFYQLPNYSSTLGEEYQPIKALKFLSTKGRDVHKWGPGDNFIVLPGYVISLLVWKIKGTMGAASSDFPYGLKNPLWQLTVLIFQSRVEFVLLGTAALFVLCRRLGKLGYARGAVLLAAFLCLAANPVFIRHCVILKTDLPMMVGSMIALAVYARIVLTELTPRRAVALAAWVAVAVTGKEIAVPLFALPIVGLGVTGWWSSRGREAARAIYWRSLLWAVVTGVGVYFVLNIVYAPSSWMQRMRIWLGGTGMDPAVWATPGRNAWVAAKEIFVMVLQNLGYGGAIALVVSVMVMIWLRPRRWIMLMLPLVSFFIVGLIPVGYSADYFGLPVAMAAMLVITPAIDRLLQMPARRAMILSVFGILAATNLLFANRAWIELRYTDDSMIEHHAVANVRAGESIGIFSLYPTIPGKSRLEHMGFNIDHRSIGTMMKSPQDLPEILYVPSQIYLWMADLPVRPKRLEMLERETTFDHRLWHGPEGLGYDLSEVFDPGAPSWYPFRKVWPFDGPYRQRLRVYRLRGGAATHPGR
jgi:hypothetical protein